MMQLIHSLFIVICAATFCFACAPLTTMCEDGSTVRYHFGYIREIIPPTKSGEK